MGGEVGADVGELVGEKVGAAVGAGVGVAVGANVVYSLMTSFEMFDAIATTSGTLAHAHVTFVSV